MNVEYYEDHLTYVANQIGCSITMEQLVSSYLKIRNDKSILLDEKNTNWQKEKTHARNHFIKNLPSETLTYDQLRKMTINEIIELLGK